MADSSVVEAWILERNQRFALDGNMLIQMADAGSSPAFQMRWGVWALKLIESPDRSVEVFSPMVMRRAPSRTRANSWPPC